MSSRDLLQQLVEVEDGRDLAAEVEERRDELALDASAGLALGGTSDLGMAHVRGHPAAEDGVIPQIPHYTALNSSLMDRAPLDYAAIERILPHRYPFLLVDRVTEFEPDKRIVGIKNVTLNERYLAHSPASSPSCRRPS